MIYIEQYALVYYKNQAIRILCPQGPLSNAYQNLLSARVPFHISAQGRNCALVRSADNYRYIIPFKSCRLADCSTVPISISMLKGGGRMAHMLEVLKLALEVALIAVQIYLLLKSKKSKKPR
jgi:hypothetical protein